LFTVQTSPKYSHRGLYIGELLADVIWGKKYEKGRRKRGKVKVKEKERGKKKGERGKKKGERGKKRGERKENEKRESKMVKYMQNREEIRQKSYDKSKKTNNNV
jgi:hypothetical protein